MGEAVDSVFIAQDLLMHAKGTIMGRSVRLFSTLLLELDVSALAVELSRFGNEAFHIFAEVRLAFLRHALY